MFIRLKIPQLYNVLLFSKVAQKLQTIFLANQSQIYSYFYLFCGQGKDLWFLWFHLTSYTFYYELRFNGVN